MITFWFRQITPQTLRNMVVPRIIPVMIAVPLAEVGLGVVAGLHAQDRHAEEEGEQSRPAEPPQRPPRDLALRLRSRIGRHLRERRVSARVEEVQQPDPRDAREDVGVARQHLPRAPGVEEPVEDLHVSPLSPSSTARS